LDVDAEEPQVPPLRFPPQRRRPVAGDPGFPPQRRRPVAGDPGFPPQRRRPVAGDPGCATVGM